MLSINFMYNYVELNNGIYLGCIILCLKHVYIINIICRFLPLKGNYIIICWEKPSGFQ